MDLDAETGLGHTDKGTAVGVADVMIAHALLNGEEGMVFASAG